MKIFLEKIEPYLTLFVLSLLVAYLILNIFFDSVTFYNYGLLFALCDTALFYFLVDLRGIRGEGPLALWYFILFGFFIISKVLLAMLSFSCATCFFGPELGFFLWPFVFGPFILINMVPPLFTLRRMNKKIGREATLRLRKSPTRTMNFVKKLIIGILLFPLVIFFLMLLAI